MNQSRIKSLDFSVICKYTPSGMETICIHLGAYPDAAHVGVGNSSRWGVGEGGGAVIPLFSSFFFFF